VSVCSFRAGLGCDPHYFDLQPVPIRRTYRLVNSAEFGRDVLRKGKPNPGLQFVRGFIVLGNLDDLFDRIEIQSLQAFAHEHAAIGSPGLTAA
jgi:hypothetical protein